MADIADPCLLLAVREPHLRHAATTALEGERYRVVSVTSAREVSTQIETRRPHLVLLELEVGGLELLRAIRKTTRAALLVVSRRDDVKERVEALDSGADDFLLAPFDATELLARLRVARRHLEVHGDEPALPALTVGPLRVDLGARLVFVEGREVHLTPIEYKLLGALVANVGRVVTHQQLLKRAWGPRFATQTHYLHVYMRQLRTKLEPRHERPRWLLTEPGIGYRLATEPRSH